MAGGARGGLGRVALPVHGYGDYAQAARAWGLAIADDAPFAWACEPSSPLGQPEPGLRERVAAGVLVALDRAYEPLRLSGESSLAGADLDRVWQLWSPNKALGLTGVRAAYAIAPDAAAAAQLDAMAPSWPVGAHGVALLLAWCEPAVQQWLRESRATLRAWKARQLALCGELGWAPRPADANFFVAAVPGLAERRAALRAQGIVLRDCASFGLPGHARLGVQAPPAQDALARAWRNLP